MFDDMKCSLSICTIQLPVHRPLKYCCVFPKSLRVFLLLRYQKMLPSAIVNCDKNLFFSIKTDSHNVLLRFHGPLPLASTEGLLNTNWQYITVHISQTPPSHVYVPHLLIFCERLGSSLAAEIIFVMSGNVSTGL